MKTYNKGPLSYLGVAYCVSLLYHLKMWFEKAQNSCATCGYLAKRTSYNFTDYHFFEVSEVERETGDLNKRIETSTKEQMKTRPVCFRQVIQMDDEIKRMTKQEEPQDRSSEKVLIRYIEGTRHAIHKARHCSKWVPYFQGFSPKEHLEEQRTRDFEQRTRNLTIFLFAITIVFTIAQIYLAIKK